MGVAKIGEVGIFWGTNEGVSGPEGVVEIFSMSDWQHF